MGFPCVDAKVEGKPIRLAIDTGDTESWHV
jgi:hypothetical protein